METFCEGMRRECAGIWEAQLAHPFLRALADGTLPQENFQFYITQDARFLIDLAKGFGYAITQSDDRDRIMVLAERAINTVQVERALHEAYAVRFGLTPAAMAATPMAPTNYAYTRHMLATAARGILAETITVMLPCAWIYAVVGQHFTTTLIRDHLAADGTLPADHPYRDWLLTYANPDFAAVGTWMRAVVDDEATRLDAHAKQRLLEIFRTSSRYEYMFWDMAWRREAWPV